MKISVLLPTRDRLELLRHAVASVRCLDDPDWEIVISDNCSAEDVAGYVASLDDARIRYLRTPEPLSVTENWNNALVHSTGEYVIMLGDDDALLNGYFKRTRRLIADFDRPQVIYHNALLFTYPDVIPEEPDGSLRAYGYAPFLRGAKLPFRLPGEQARALVRRAADFHSSYGFNIQFVTFSRSLVAELSSDGDFFHPPFPDYYAMNHMFARAHSIVAEPHPLVVIGLSPRSHGFFCHHDRETEGRAFLEAREAPGALAQGRSGLLPGTNINNGWLLTVEDLYRRLGRPAGLKPNYRRYRMLQILHVYNGRHLQGAVSAERVAELKRHMTRRERLLYGSLFAALAAVARVLPATARAHVPRVVTLIARQIPWWRPVPDPGRYRDISEVVTRVNGDDNPARWGVQQDSRLTSEILTRVFP